MDAQEHSKTLAGEFEVTMLGSLAWFSITILSACLATVTDKAVKLVEDPRYEVATVIDVDAHPGSSAK
jgi:hypothetical protein